MNSDTKKLLIQVISVLLFSRIGWYILSPTEGGNMGKIFISFIKGHLLLCMIGLLISDIIIFLRRPRFVAAVAALGAGLVGIIVGSILGFLFAVLIDLLIGIYPRALELIVPIIVSIIFMVFSYNFVAKRVRW